ncbi:MAG: DUF362 domain-containing protein [Desulfovibrio sp.]|nr:DUF362 domain-containing protein [Desulfovibrio sp.]
MMDGEESKPQMENRRTVVALARCADYSAPGIADGVRSVLDASKIVVRAGSRVLVKPNLLLPVSLACTSPAVVAAVCAWLLERGAQVVVADSPGFGRGPVVARKIGLEEALRPLGLAVCAMDEPVATDLSLASGKARFRISRRALEADVIVSVPRVKAHSQMRASLAVKNCFGCVCGLSKALIHAREGRDPDFFADCLAALWAVLPPVAGVADGVTAMHVTGPSKGLAYPLGLLGASDSAVALDEAVLAALGLAPADTPLGAALARRLAQGSAAAGWRAEYPLRRPEEWRPVDFCFPVDLSHTSFAPGRLVKSCLRRIVAACRN